MKDTALNCLFVLILVVNALCWDEEPNRLPTKCETCKFMTEELTTNLRSLNSDEKIVNEYFNLESSKTDNKEFKQYKNSEVRLTEAISTACKNLLKYQVHSKRPGSLRFSTDEHPAIKEFKGLIQEGADIDIGIPYDLWDRPNVEVMNLKKSCDLMIEIYEEEIENWYFNHREKNTLAKYLCEDLILKNDDKRCLKEKESMNRKEDL